MILPPNVINYISGYHCWITMLGYSLHASALFILPACSKINAPLIFE